MSRHTVTVAPFDAADFLDSEETIVEFLNAAAEDETPGAFMIAIEAVAKARGMAQVAEDSGLSRESLYKALAPDAQPRFDTVRRVLGALGAELAVVPRNASSRRGSARTATSRFTGGVFAKKAPSTRAAFAKSKVKRSRLTGTRAAGKRSASALKSSSRNATRSKPGASRR